MFLCAPWPLIASGIPLHINASVRYTEIIATYNGSSTLCKHVFFPTGLYHYCTEYNSVAPPTTTLHLSITSVHSPSHTLLFFEFFCPSLVSLSLSSATHHSKDGTVKIVFTHSFPHTISLFLSCLYSCAAFCSHAFQIHFFSGRHVSKYKSFSNCIYLPLRYVNVLGQCAQGLARQGPLLCEWEPLLSDMLLCELW